MPRPGSRLPQPEVDLWRLCGRAAGGALTQDDIRYLNFQSGYTRFHMCRQGQTVEECRTSMLNRRGAQDTDPSVAFCTTVATCSNMRL